MSANEHTVHDNYANGPENTQWDISVDQNVLAHFPPGSRIVSAYRFATSLWTQTARLAIEHPNGEKKVYFLKSALDRIGLVMMEGEFNAMSELYKFAPNFVPKPYAWGTYHNKLPETYFFLSQFIEMSDKLPEPEQLCRKLAQLHETSFSPTGKFGFHVATSQGCTPQDVSWESSWAVFFSKLVAHVLDLDGRTNGAWKNFDTLARRALQVVVPRLIGALEADGRSVKPSLIHGDLWEGNTGTSVKTGDIYLFDSAAFYAHNKMEIGNWRCHYNKIHDSRYTQTYRSYVEASEPQEEWDDRNRMYSVYYNIIYSVNHKSDGTAVRQRAYDDLYYLVNKYAPFEDGTGPPPLAEHERVELTPERDHTLN